MPRLWQLITKEESGQALLAVLVCLIFGGLLIASSNSFIDTSFRYRLSLERNYQGLYAAEAGIEDVLWCIKHGTSFRSELPQNLNGNQVTMQTTTTGNCTIYADEWITIGGHSTWLLVSGDVEDLAGDDKYTITVTWNAESETIIHLSEIGAKLPPGYSYQPGSAADFGGNLSTEEPDDELAEDGSHLLKWVFSSPRPHVEESEPVGTQEFYITGAGALENDYAWVSASREDIGAISELTGEVYTITATATKDGAVTARITANAMLFEGDLYIISWQVNPPEE